MIYGHLKFQVEHHKRVRIRYDYTKCLKTPLRSWEPKTAQHIHVKNYKRDILNIKVSYEHAKLLFTLIIVRSECRKVAKIIEDPKIMMMKNDEITHEDEK